MRPRNLSARPREPCQLGRVERDFEKGEHDGAEAALRVVGAIARAWLAREEPVVAVSGGVGIDGHAG
ncbi:MAG: hypothetical protein HY060_13250 [Proteobacteria bacterium]|nr:hypothetical protein [Pseudomonadota bacterium]